MPRPGSTLRPTTVSDTVRPRRSLAGDPVPDPDVEIVHRADPERDLAVGAREPAGRDDEAGPRSGGHPADRRDRSSGELDRAQREPRPVATAGSASRIRPAASWFAWTAAGSSPPTSTPASHVQPNSRGVVHEMAEAGGRRRPPPSPRRPRSGRSRWWSAPGPRRSRGRARGRAGHPRPEPARAPARSRTVAVLEP